jgi:hypothetical protein
MLTIASLVSSAILSTVLLFTGKLNLILRSSGKELINSAILGLINPFLYYLILLKAYDLLPAQVAQPLNMIWPIILYSFRTPAQAKNKSEKLSRAFNKLCRSISYLISGGSFTSGAFRYPGSIDGYRKFGLLGSLFHPQS